MRVKGHGTIKISKAYGAIGTLLLSGVLFLVGTSGAYADEAQPNAAVDSVQIDGNLGFVAGINEMLLTEEDGVIYLLPGLPENYAQSGSASGMLVNGARLSFEWKNGSVTKISADAPVRVCCINVCSWAELDGDIALVPQSAAEGE